MVNGVNVFRDSEVVAIGTLHKIKHDRPAPQCHNIGQFDKVLGAARAGRYEVACSNDAGDSASARVEVEARGAAVELRLAR